MFQSQKSKPEEESAVESIDKVLLDAIRGVIYESHEQHVGYEDEATYEEYGSKQSSQGDGGGSSGGGGGGMLPMLLVGVALGAIGYLYGKRSGSGSGMMDSTSEKIDKAAGRTEEIAGNTAETVRQSGQEFSERTEETASQASERIEDTSEQFGDQIEEGGSKAADEMEDKS